MGKNSKILPSDVSNLYEAPAERMYEISEMPDTGLLESLGVRLKAYVYKKYAYSFGGPVLVTIDDSKIAIGKDVARKICVREVC